MSLRTRTRWLAALLGIGVALALPVGASAQDEGEPSEQAAEDEAEAEDEEEEEGAADWEATHGGLYLSGNATYAFLTQKSDIESAAEHAADLSGLSSRTDDTWGYGVRLGYRLNERLAQCVAHLTTNELAAALTNAGVPVAPVNTLAEVLTDPLLGAALARARDPRTGLEIALPPLAEVVGDDLTELTFPPRLGEHNDQIYGGLLDYGPHEVARLRQSGVI